MVETQGISSARRVSSGQCAGLEDLNGWCAPGAYASLPMEGRVVIVTGGSSGIGRETARRLARQGCNVILACRSEGRAGRAAAEIRESSHRTIRGGSGLGIESTLLGRGGVEPMVLDLADQDSIR